MVSIIIVNFNTGDVLKECITSLFRYEAQESFEAIIVDNNSSDNSREIIDKLAGSYPVKKVYLEKDEGFSFANNRGYELARGEYILIMNPDIIFTEPLLNKLTGLFKDNNIGAACPALVGTDGKFQRNYFQRFPSLRQYLFFNSVFAKLFNRSASLMNKYLENQDVDISKGTVQQVEQIPFAFFLTSRRIFEEMNGLDEQYPLFFEDVDMSYRINKRYKLVIDTSLKVTHLGGTSFKTENNWWLYGRYVMSMNYFFDKNYSFIRAFLLKLFTAGNSLFIVVTEQLKRLIGKPDEYRFKKHRYFLKEFFKYYF
jgi:GT2 family glycosyltransferase